MFHIQHFERYLKEGRDRLTYLAKIRANGLGAVGDLNNKATRNRIKKTGSSFAVPPYRAITYGSTSNNRREFTFLEGKLRNHGIRCQLTNIADQPRAPLSERHYRHKKGLLDRLWNRIQEHAIDLGEVALNDLHADYCMTFYRSFFSFTASLLSGSIRQNIPFSLVSNDHAPMPVAFAQVCRAFGIPVGYIQHAEINSKFPPLAFDFAVLNNAASLEIYRSISSQLPPTFILPRFDSAPDKEKLNRNLSKPVRVGVFLTSLCDFKRLGELIEALKSNAGVESVGIQPHPRASQHELFQIQRTGVSVGRLDFKQVDVAVCQNTSSVIELLHHGIKTLQIFEYDFVTDDHYGFVKNGIVPRLQKNELTGPFWEKCSFTNAWESEYGKYSPTYIGRDDSEDLCQYLTKYLAGVRSAPSRRGVLTASSFIHTVGRGKSDARALRQEVLSCLRLNPGVSVDKVVAWVRERAPTTGVDLSEVTLRKTIRETVVNLYIARDPDIVAWMNRGGKTLSATSLGAWASLYSRFWTSSSLTNEEVEFFLSIRHEPAGSPFAGECESLLCCLVVRRNDIKLTERYLSANRSVSSLRLDLRARTELGRHLFANKNILPEATPIRSRLVYDLTGLNRIRAEIIGCARPGIEVSLDHKQTEQEVVNHSVSKLRQELERFVLPFYEKHRNRMQFMELFWKDAQRKQFFELAREALTNRSPLSYLRLSDGEGWIFANEEGPFSVGDEVNRERHWWGRSPSKKEKNRLRTDAFAAVRSADILGIPSIYRVLQSLGSRSTTMTGSVTSRGLLQVLISLRSWDFSEISFSDEKGNIPLFRNVAELQCLFDMARKVVFITSVKRETLERVFQPIRLLEKLEYVEVPTHYRTRSNTDYRTGDAIFPEIYDSIQSRVADTSGPGVLILNASGVAGKGLNDIAKNKGGVVLDIGGAIDVWVQAVFK